MDVVQQNLGQCRGQEGEHVLKGMGGWRETRGTREDTPLSYLLYVKPHGQKGIHVHILYITHPWFYWVRALMTCYTKSEI